MGNTTSTQMKSFSKKKIVNHQLVQTYAGNLLKMDTSWFDPKEYAKIRSDVKKRSKKYV